MKVKKAKQSKNIAESTVLCFSEERLYKNSIILLTTQWRYRLETLSEAALSMLNFSPSFINSQDR
ncbi:MAG TPA: hypothetical protein VF571_09605 [Pyrinomonadaceae bacterium]|jgi:hypothetical protein